MCEGQHISEKGMAERRESEGEGDRERERERERGRESLVGQMNTMKLNV